MRTSFLIFIGLTILVVASAAKPKKSAISKSAPAEKAAEEEDIEIPANVDDILKNEEDGEDEIRIPDVEELTTESNPVELGQRIKSLTDKKKIKTLTAELKNAWNENKGEPISGKFYRAAYDSLSKKKGAEEKADKFWKKELKKALKYIKNAGKDIVDQTQASIGDVVDNTINDLGEVTDLTYKAIKTVPVPML